MMNKRADIMNNLLGIIIAVIGILLLAMAAYKLYQIAVSGDAENAKATLNVIEAKINALNVGETGKFPVTAINGWFITGWGKYDYNKPAACLNSCVCICKSKDAVDLATSGDNQRMSDCQLSGFCRNIDAPYVLIQGMLENAKKNNELFAPTVPFPMILFSKSNLVELNITKIKQSDGIHLSIMRTG